MSNPLPARPMKTPSRASSVKNARCASPTSRRRASSASCSEEPPADHHRAGTQPPRWPGLPAAAAARAAGSDQEVREHRRRCSEGRPGEGWPARRAGHLRGAA
ncbi:hypothetical protein G6F68_019063 [Rhizopus microsporus]|nr:hypothetical protein G6F68_019063 [Rhizopus microsporus]